MGYRDGVVKRNGWMDSNQSSITKKILRVEVPYKPVYAIQSIILGFKLKKMKNFWAQKRVNFLSAYKGSCRWRFI